MSKKPTPEQREQQKEKRLQKKYGISLARRNEMAHEQNHKCKICGGALDAYGPPHVDHFHFKIEAERDPNVGWRTLVRNELGIVRFRASAPTRKAAEQEVRDQAKDWSVRGLLCFKCNRGLGAVERLFGAARHPENLVPVIEYFTIRLNKQLDNPLEKQ